MEIGERLKKAVSQGFYLFCKLYLSSKTGMSKEQATKILLFLHELLLPDNRSSMFRRRKQ